MDEHGTALSPGTSLGQSAAQERFDLLISRVLRQGVTAAAVIGAVELVLSISYFVRGPQFGEPQSLHELYTLRASSLATSPQQLLQNSLLVRRRTSCELAYSS